MLRHTTTLLCLLTALLCHNNRALAQDVVGDSVAADRQTPAVAMGTDTLTGDEAIDIILPDSAWNGKKARKAKRDWNTWRCRKIRRCAKSCSKTNMWRTWRSAWA